MKPFAIIGHTPSSIILASELIGKTTEPIHASNSPNTLRRNVYNEFILINWGRQTKYAHVNARTIDQRWDKATQSQIIHQAGITQVALYMRRTEVTKDMLPIIQRDHYHTKGLDIRLVKRMRDLQSDKWYVRVFEKDTEYRIHVAFGQVIKVQEKLIMRHTDNNQKLLRHSDGWPLIWCQDNCTFERCDYTDPLYELINQTSIDAVQALELDFGAVDIGVRGDHDEVCVFEVNMAPSLNQHTARQYARAFRNHFENQNKEEVNTRHATSSRLNNSPD